MTYNVTVTRENGLWVADIHGDDLGPAATDTERFAHLDTEVHDLIAGLTDTDPGDFDITWRYVIDGNDVTAAVTRLGAAETELRAASSAREEARVGVLDQLARAGLSQAAIGEVLGLSHQRVHQLLKDSPGHGTGPARRSEDVPCTA
jgi:predicted XRE-type DNA-binding protein